MDNLCAEKIRYEGRLTYFVANGNWISEGRMRCGVTMLSSVCSISIFMQIKKILCLKRLSK